MKTLTTLLLFTLTTNLFGITINGKVTCSNSDVPIPNALIITFNSFGEIDSLYADSVGTFKLALSRKKTYKITAHSSLMRSNGLKSEPRYSTSKPKIINLIKVYAAPSFVHIEMEPVRVADNSHLRVNFIKNTDSITTRTVLENVFQTLTENNITKVEVVGFLCSGEDSLLRMFRAEKVKFGLIKLGYDQSKITINNSVPNKAIVYETYSCEGFPLVEPKENVKNARVELKVIKRETD